MTGMTMINHRIDGAYTARGVQKETLPKAVQNKIAWRSGRRVADLWKKLGNRVQDAHDWKAPDAGRHKYAIYPEWFAPHIDNITQDVIDEVLLENA